MSFLSLKSRDIGIDLGTANILVTLNGKGIVYREPAVIAIENQTGNVIAIGSEAKEMLGRTPKEISAIRPLKDGVIADFTATKLLLKRIMDKVCKKYNAVRPRVIVGVPSGITEVEERAVEETIIRAGAKEVYLIEEPMAAAIGAGIEIEQPSGNIIVDIGGGTTEVAVISLGGIVLSNSIRIAGDELNEDIINYVKRELNLAIGETTAENIKKELGCALPLMSQMSMKIKGRDLSTGLPATEIITSGQVEEAIKDAIENCKINNITNAEYLAGDTEKLLTDLIENRKIKPDVIVVDPPRKGLDNKTVENILKIKPNRVVYISCNPATLMRDLSKLESEYKIKEIQPVDMFPFTSHVECCSVLYLKDSIQ